jgi:protein required for attachment to host cells
MRITWGLVADEAIARILQWSPASEQLESIEDLSADDYGLDAPSFCRHIANRLAEARHLGLFHELRIAASPKFMPMLHSAFNAEVSAAVTAEVHRDMIYLTNGDITQCLITEQAPATWQPDPGRGSRAAPGRLRQ